MRNIFDIIADADDTETAECIYPSTVDVIISYVNCSDRNWVNSFIQTTHSHNPSAVRYRSWNTLRYLFRGISNYMPFVRDVLLVVASPSQVPSWIDKNQVRIVYHNEFIPEQFLPTFNSCTIESFFWNIKGLADKIIYFNDDMFPVGMMSESDFFTGNIPHIKFLNPEEYSPRNVFRNQCRSGMDLMTKVLGLPQFEPKRIIRPNHIATALTKDCLNKVAELCEVALPKTITTLRAPKNVNQYIYAYYHYFTGDYINDTCAYQYLEIDDKNIENITATILRDKYQIVCLNDSDRIVDYARLRYLLTSCFEKKFPNKSQYEL